MTTIDTNQIRSAIKQLTSAGAHAASTAVWDLLDAYLVMAAESTTTALQDAFAGGFGPAGDACAAKVLEKARAEETLRGRREEMERLAVSEGLLTEPVVDSCMVSTLYSAAPELAGKCSRPAVGVVASAEGIETPACRSCGTDFAAENRRRHFVYEECGNA